jgi:peptidoglycan/xylan/chitin deacetylase (PgdA/CDA1 family)
MRPAPGSTLTAPAAGARLLGKRALIARVVETSGAGVALRRLPSWRGVLVLAYHRIGDGRHDRLDRQLWSATAEQLDRQLSFVSRNFEVIGPEQLSERGRGRRVMITFDDGYRDLYEAAFPALQSNGLRALMFPCSGFIDRVATAWWDEIAWALRTSRRPALPPGPWSATAIPLEAGRTEPTIELVNQAFRRLSPRPAAEFLELLGEAAGTGRRPRADSDRDWITWSQAREMQAAGHHFGAHTVTHPVLARLPLSAQREEIVGSIERIEAELGRRPRYFCYPVGLPDSFTAATSACLADAGIELAFSDYGGYVSGRDFDRYDVRRTNVGSELDAPRFAAMLTLPQLFASG